MMEALVNFAHLLKFQQQTELLNVNLVIVDSKPILTALLALLVLLVNTPTMMALVNNVHKEVFLFLQVLVNVKFAQREHNLLLVPHNVLLVVLERSLLMELLVRLANPPILQPILEQIHANPALLVMERLQILLSVLLVLLDTLLKLEEFVLLVYLDMFRTLGVLVNLVLKTVETSNLLNLVSVTLVLLAFLPPQEDSALVVRMDTFPDLEVHVWLAHQDMKPILDNLIVLNVLLEPTLRMESYALLVSQVISPLERELTSVLLVLQELHPTLLIRHVLHVLLAIHPSQEVSAQNACLDLLHSLEGSANPAPSDMETLLPFLEYVQLVPPDGLRWRVVPVPSVLLVKSPILEVLVLIVQPDFLLSWEALVQLVPQELLLSLEVHVPTVPLDNSPIQEEIVLPVLLDLVAMLDQQAAIHVDLDRHHLLEVNAQISVQMDSFGVKHSNFVSLVTKERLLLLEISPVLAVLLNISPLAIVRPAFQSQWLVTSCVSMRIFRHLVLMTLSAKLPISFKQRRVKSMFWHPVLDLLSTTLPS